MSNSVHNEPYRVIITGGGTGGHIYPAIAIANALREQVENIEILFVGAKDKMEMQKVPQAGYKIIGLSITGIQRRLSWQNLMFPFRLAASIVHASSIIKRFKPHVVVGVGGYASGPVVYAATRKRIPALIQEQNGYAGLANKWLARKVQTICVAYQHMERFFPREKLVLTGNPVRSDIKENGELKRRALEYFMLTADKPTILAIGGSLGARTINHSLLSHLSLFSEHGIQLIWQTGKFYYQEVKDQIPDLERTDIRLYEFITEMNLAYAVADVVISRAGALSIAELSLSRKPVILVPSPNVAEDHQTKNAMALVEANAAVLVSDHQAPQHLAREAVALVENEQKRRELGRNIGKMARPKAADDIAREVMKLAN